MSHQHVVGHPAVTAAAVLFRLISQQGSGCPVTSSHCLLFSFDNSLMTIVLALQVILIVGAMQMAMAAYGFQAPNMSKVIGAMLIGIAGAQSRHWISSSLPAALCFTFKRGCAP
jgi:hypothetical protein